MIYQEKNPITGQVVRNDLTTLPYLSITRDSFINAKELLSTEEFGNVMMDLINDIFECGDKPLRKTKAENVIYNQMSRDIGRLSSGYFKKCRNLKNNKNKIEDNG